MPDAVSSGAVSSAAERIRNLAIKPDNGGNPVTSNAHPIKLRPRNAIAAGMTIPTTSSSEQLGFERVFEAECSAQRQYAFAELLGTFDHFAQHEKSAGSQNRADQIKQRRALHPRSAQPDRRQQRAGRRDDAIRGQPLRLMRRQHAGGAQHKRDQPMPNSHPSLNGAGAPEADEAESSDPSRSSA